MKIPKEEFKQWMILKNFKEEYIKKILNYANLFEIYEVFNQEAADTFIAKHNLPVARAFIMNYQKFLVHNKEKLQINRDEVLRLKEIEIPRITGRKKIRIPKILTYEQILYLEKYMMNERDKIMLLLSFYCSLRAGELLKIKPYSFNWKLWKFNQNNPCELRVFGKGDKERIAIVPSEFMFRIESWIKNYASKKQPNPNLPLFKISTRRWEHILDSAALKAFNVKIHPHCLRHCLSEETKILTFNGWKSYKELKVGDNIYSYNLLNERIETDKIQNINIYDYDDKAYHLITRHLDLLCTSEHKGIFKIAKMRQKTINGKKKRWDEWDKWKLISVNDVLNIKNKRLIKYKVSGISDGSLSIGKAKAGIIGWILTDGSINYKKRSSDDITITQSLTANKLKCDYIRKLLIEANILFSETKIYSISFFDKKEKEYVKFRLLNGGNKGKIKGENNNWIFEFINKDRTPKYNILNLKQEELKEIYKCIMMGDGSRNELTTQNEKRIEFFRTLCAFIGKNALTCLGQHNKKEKGIMKFRTYITNKNSTNIIIKKDFVLKDYKGKMWCPETKNHTFIAQNNGKIFITGNSGATHLLSQGVPLEEVKELLGHSSIMSTQIYIHINKDSIKNKVQRIYGLNYLQRAKPNQLSENQF